MNFNLLFSALSALSVIIEFTVNKGERQDYFLFVGNKTNAHLFRENTTLYLHLSSGYGEMFSIYNSSIVNMENFQFSWNGFAVNGKKMNSQRSIGMMGRLEFENFTFISPIVNIFDLECTVETIYNNVEIVNYWYFLIMMVGVAVGFGSTSKAMDLFKRFLNRRESTYVTMTSKRNPSQSEEYEIETDV